MLSDWLSTPQILLILGSFIVYQIARFFSQADLFLYGLDFIFPPADADFEKCQEIAEKKAKGAKKFQNVKPTLPMLCANLSNHSLVQHYFHSELDFVLRWTLAVTIALVGVGFASFVTGKLSEYSTDIFWMSLSVTIFCNALLYSAIGITPSDRDHVGISAVSFVLYAIFFFLLLDKMPEGRLDIDFESGWKSAMRTLYGTDEELYPSTAWFHFILAMVAAVSAALTFPASYRFGRGFQQMLAKNDQTLKEEVEDARAAKETPPPVTSDAETACAEKEGEKVDDDPAGKKKKKGGGAKKGKIEAPVAAKTDDDEDRKAVPVVESTPLIPRLRYSVRQVILAVNYMSMLFVCLLWVAPMIRDRVVINDAAEVSEGTRRGLTPSDFVLIRFTVTTLACLLRLVYVRPMVQEALHTALNWVRSYVTEPHLYEKQQVSAKIMHPFRHLCVITYELVVPPVMLLGLNIALAALAFGKLKTEALGKFLDLPASEPEATDGPLNPFWESVVSFFILTTSMTYFAVALVGHLYHRANPALALFKP